MFPISDIRLNRQSDGGGYILTSNYSSQNYISLNNRSNYSPTFPQTQTNGVYSTKVDVIDPFAGASDYYNVETTFDPTFYSDEDKYFVLEFSIYDTMLLNDYKGYELYSELGFSKIAQYMPYFFIDESVQVTPEGESNDFDILVDYSAIVVYFDKTGKERVKTFQGNGDYVTPHYENGRIYYYAFEPLLEQIGSGIMTIYVDYLCIHQMRSYGNYVEQGIGNTYAFYDEDRYRTDKFTFEDLFYNEYFDYENYMGQIMELEFQVSSLESEREILLSNLNELQNALGDEIENSESLTSEILRLEGEIENLEARIRLKNEEMEKLEQIKNQEIKALEQKNFELRNTSGAISEYFTGISSALWDGLNEITDIGYSYVDSDGNTQTVTIGSLITVTVIGVVAFFIIKLFRGG